MGRGTQPGRGALGAGVLLVALAVLLAAVLLAAAPRAAIAAGFDAAVPPRYDRTYKCDLLERLPAPPELVIFGGSRAQRFQPAAAERLIGLSTFNFAVQNSRPEDVYAMTRFLLWRAPSVRLRCLWALQATTLSDSPLHPGLLTERRLAQFLPAGLVAAQSALSLSTEGRQMQWTDEYTARGLLRRNRYDLRLERGRPLAIAMRDYLARMVPKVASPSAYAQVRAKAYFERTLQLFNLQDVEPVLVIMPYHPAALAAFRAAGWDTREDAFKAYLAGLRWRYRFRILDYTELASFHGDAAAFYDGAHVKAANARRILAQAVKDAPEAFR